MKEAVVTELRAVLVYNDCCPFCKGVAHWLQKKIGNSRLAIVPNTEPWAVNLHPDLNADNIKINVHLVKMDKISIKKCGRTAICIEHNKKTLSSAGGAVIAVLSMKQGLQWLRHTYKIPVLKQLIDFSYWLLKKTKKYYA